MGAFCLQITFPYNCNSKESTEEPLELIISYHHTKTNKTQTHTTPHTQTHTSLHTQKSVPDALKN